MNTFEAKNIRNIAILGHQSSGKTSISEAILNVAGVIEKKGIVEKGTTVSDYTKEEKGRNISISMSILPVEYNNHKYNFLDTPGYSDFIGEVNSALRVASGVVIVIDATKGVEVGTEAAWRYIRSKNIPAIIFVNKMDKENIKFENVLNEIREKLGKRAVPFATPIGRSEDFEGFVNVVDMKARIHDGEKCVDAEIWEEKREKVDELHDLIIESVAETNDDLMEKYFNEEPFSDEEIHKGLREGILDGKLTPIIVGSAAKNIGFNTLLDMLYDYMPTADENKVPTGINPESNEKITREVVYDAPFSAIVFKTLMDPFLGQISLFQVRSGHISRDQEIVIANNGKKLKMGQIYFLRGKEQIQAEEVVAGDIGIVVKMHNLFTSCTICDPNSIIQYREIPNPSPTFYLAIHPKNKNDEDKLSESLNKLNKEDVTFELVRNRETQQFLIGGQGLMHIEVVIEKLKNNFNVEVTTDDPKVVYRETIKGKSSAEGKHKKQSGGSGQFGHVHIRFERCEEDFIFEEDIFGGAVPKNYFPAVEKGLREACEHGILAGFNVIGLKATLYDGSYHPVDSNEISFKLAAQIAFKEGCKNAQPTILEPIMKIKVTVKDEFIGDIMGDLNKRRGRLLGMEPAEYESWQTIQAHVPQAEALKYSIDLKAMTQASGIFAMEFDHYEEVPSQMQEKIIKAAKEEK
ncbi:elongation factor G [Mycoplasmatota bacterium]|nr:elongation factor G [Mycoplasmatota bacterium]